VIGGIELGGTKCIVAVANNPLDIIDKKVIPTRDPKNTFVDIISFFNQYEINKLGVGTFGPLILDNDSTECGLIVAESKKGWKNINVVGELSIISSNIFVDTDVNAAALGEYYYGSGNLCQTLVYVTVGTGIGVGVLLGGKPHVGNFHLEIGHMIIPNSDNFEGVCGIHGNCWEGLASGPSMQSRWKDQASVLPEKHVAWELEAELLAMGLVNIISNHSPDRIILGGGVMNQKHLFPMIRTKVKELWNNFTPLVPLSDLILEPKLGKDSGIVGSLSLTRDEN
tara:strand:- start:37 stop:882 length:846 start_codon:yes stop_codon:yes gene_type:complete